MTNHGRFLWDKTTPMGESIRHTKLVGNCKANRVLTEEKEA
jgi:hypothetical protein